MGFGGKLCIHADQVMVANEWFAPSVDKIRHAEAMIAVFDAAARENSAALAVGGQFFDAPAVERAHQVLAKDQRHSY